MTKPSWTYFAYGSNLLHARLRARTPSATPVGMGCLRGHLLKFHKVGDDGSAKCDAYETHIAEDVVWGRLFHLDPLEKPILDAIEGVGHGYELKQIQVECHGDLVPAWIYVVQKNYIDPKLKPFEWYHRFVLDGAIESGFPHIYVDQIRQVTTMEDPNQDRRERNHRVLLT